MQNIEELIQLLNIDQSLVKTTGGGGSAQGAGDVLVKLGSSGTETIEKKRSGGATKDDYTLVKLPISLPLLDQLNSLKSISPLPSSPNLFSTVFSATEGNGSTTDSDMDSSTGSVTTPSVHRESKETGDAGAKNEYEAKTALINDLVDKIIAKNINTKSLAGLKSINSIEFQYPMNDFILNETQLKQSRLNSDQSGGTEDDLILSHSIKTGSDSATSEDSQTKYKINWKCLIVKLHQLIIQSGLYHNLLKKISNQNTSTQLESSQTLLSKEYNKITSKQVSLSSNDLMVKQSPPSINISGPNGSTNKSSPMTNPPPKDFKSTPVSPLYSPPLEGAENDDQKLPSQPQPPPAKISASSQTAVPSSSSSGFSLSALMASGNKNNMPKSLRDLEERSAKVDQMKLQSQQVYEITNPNMNKLPTSYETDPVMLPDGSEYSNVKPSSSLPGPPTGLNASMSTSMPTSVNQSMISQFSPTSPTSVPLVIGSTPQQTHPLLSPTSTGAQIYSSSPFSIPSAPSGNQSNLSTSSGMPPTRLTESFFPTSTSRGPPSYDSMGGSQPHSMLSVSPSPSSFPNTLSSSIGGTNSIPISSTSAPSNQVQPPTLSSSLTESTGGLRSSQSMAQPILIHPSASTMPIAISSSPIMPAIDTIVPASSSFKGHTSTPASQGQTQMHSLNKPIGLNEIYTFPEWLDISIYLPNSGVVDQVLSEVEESKLNSSDDNILLDIQSLLLCEKSIGRLDHYLEAKLVSVINGKLSRMVKSINWLDTIYNYWLKSTNIKYFQSISKQLDLILVNFNNKIWNKEKYEMIVNRVVNLRRVYPPPTNPVSVSMSSSPINPSLFSKRPPVAQVNSQEEEMEMTNLLKRIEEDTLYLIKIQNQVSLRWIEKLVIGLLGHTSDEVRQCAVRLLNVIYDSHSWQFDEPLKSVIRVIGDAFRVELDLESPLPDEVAKRIFVLTVVPPTQRLSNHRPSSGSPATSLFIRHKVKSDGSRLHLELPSFYRSGYYDWRIVELDSSGNYQPFDFHNYRIKSNSTTTLPNELIQGRFIVHPRLREEIMHEVWVDLQDSVWDPSRGEMVKKGNIQNLIDALDHYHQDGITTIYVMGLLEKLPNNQPLCPTDRDLPNRALGGIPQFNKLIQRAKQLNIKIVIDSTARLSSKSPHRKYNGIISHQINEMNGQLGRAEGSDSVEFTWPDCLQMNFRKLSVWEMYINETLKWGERGVDGVRIDSAHICPLIIRSNLEELYRLDSDDLPHYSNQQIFDGEIVLKPSEEGKNFGYWGTTPPSPKHSSPFYPNPLFIKLTREIWHRFPQFVFLAEVYWERELHSIISGLVPYSSAIPKALASVFDKGISKDGIVYDLRQRQNVKALYDYYEMRMSTYPQNSIILFPSSTHHSPYPLSIYNAGAWAAVDMLYFLPEIPITYIGEQSGWYYPVDIQTSRVKMGMSSTPYQLQLPQIKGHYAHRVTLRKTHSLLRRGGMIPLLCYHQHGWHDRVFGFARFSDQEVAIIAINFDNHETEFYVDCSPLAKISTEDSIYRMVDLINPSNPPQYLSLTELLYEKHFVQVPGYSSICWGIYHQVSSPAAVRVLYEHSITRLKQLLADDVDPSHNLIYSMLKKALTTSVDAFAKAIENILSNLSGNTEKSFSHFIQSVLYQMTKSFEGYKILSYLAVLAKDSPSPRIQKICKETIHNNILGPIVFITPEIGRFSTVGGVGVMLDELTRSLQLLGCEVHIISPYYNYGKGGRTGYLEKEEGIKWQRNVITYVGPDRVEVGVHEGNDKGIHLHFLHHFEYFPTPYNSGSPIHQLKTIVLFAKASLELLCQIRLLPSVIVTNDWFCGLVPGYAKSGAFGTTFNGTTLFHLVHNLEEAYQGRIYPDGGTDDLSWIHHLHRDLIVDPFSHQLCLNASRCALMSSNNWGTVSKSYLYDLLRTSHLANLLHRFPHAFAHSNGIRVKDRITMMEKVSKSHEEAKAQLQEKYFKVVDPTIPVFSFVGRIVLQKGVHLILNAMRELIQHYQGKVQILVGGMANMKDPYASSCAWSMQALSKQFPSSFWADPDAFFYDGPLVNLGSDFGLMPSLFEPSGVVQQEYFVAGTPVIAFKTGGLKDTVFEYNMNDETGNGFTFEAHRHTDFVQAVHRAFNIYQNAHHYAKIRQRSKESVLDMSVVAEAWAKEFSRMRRSIWADQNLVENYSEQLRSNSSLSIQEIQKQETK